MLNRVKCDCGSVLLKVFRYEDGLFVIECQDCQAFTDLKEGN